MTENGDAKTETNGEVVKEDVIKEDPIKEVAEDDGDKEKGDTPGPDLCREFVVLQGGRPAEGT